MLKKFFNKYSLTRIKKLSDPKTAGLIVFTVIILLVTWSGFQAVQQNFGLEKQVQQLQQQNSVQKLINDNQRLQNEYYNSKQYLELSARQNLGLADPGESEIIVPKNVAMSFTKDLPTNESAPKSVSKEPFYIRNLKNWWNFFLGRRSEASQN